MNATTPQIPAIQQPVNTPIQSTEAISKPTSPQTSDIWFWLSLFLAAGWLLTLIAWWQKHRSAETKKDSKQKKAHSASLSSANKALKKACEKNDAQACKDALISWGKAIFPSHPPSSLGHLAELAGEPLKARVCELEEILYSSSSNTWKTTGLWEITRQVERELAQKNLPLVGSLEPLHK